MKYLSSTLLLLIASIVFIGCDVVHITDKLVIKKQEMNGYPNHKGKFKYTADEDYHYGEVIIITDSIYSVGDTITFKK
jgi:hypothetical protein